MKPTKQMKAGLFQWRYYGWVLAVIWTVIIGASLGWNIYQTKQKTLEVAYIQAKISLEKEIEYRRWNSSHGGVYIPVTEKLPPSPYLSHIPERDISTPSGRLLTLMNHADMTRQVNEIAQKERHFWAHLTGLKPIRPENASDRLEKEALQAFVGGETEARSIKKIGGQDYFHLMRPFRTEESCLKCHAGQGYRKGEIQSVISLSSSMADLYPIEWKSMRRAGATHILIWLIGLGGIGLMARRITRSEAVRKQAQEVLKNSEDRYRSLFESIPIGMYRSTPDGRIIDANTALVQMLGYPDRDSLLAVKSSDTYMNPQDRVTWKNLMEQQGIVRSYEKQRRRSDGTVILAEENSRAIRDLGGRVQYYEGSLQDITERKQVEKALQESEGLYRTLIETSPDAIVLVDMNTNLIMVNQVAVRLYGYQNAEEMIGKTFLNLIVPEERSHLFVHFKDTRQTGSNHILEHTSLKKDGSSFHAAVNASLICDEQGIPKGIVAIIRDMTERKRAEQTLLESEARFRDVALSMSDWVWEVDSQGRYIYCSDKVVDVLGYTREEILGKTPFDLMPPDEATRISRIFEEIIKDQKSILDLENWNLHRDGRMVCLLTNGVPMFDKKGQWIGYRGVDKDITERKRAQEEREKLIRDLQGALNKVKTLSGMLPICASCKRIRDDKGYWNQIEVYIRDHSDTEFTHGICPECFKKLYPNESLEDL